MTDAHLATPGTDETTAPRSGHVPLVVDVDGTLVEGDTLVESALHLIAFRPLALLRMTQALARGRASLKGAVAAAVDLDEVSLRLNPAVLAEIDDAKAVGRPVYLASGADRRYVESMAARVGGVAGIFASEGRENLTGEAKAKRLVEAFGRAGFDYIGNERRDLPVWEAARRALVAQGGRRLKEKVKQLDPKATFLRATEPSTRVYLRALRPHQWLKNILVFLPLLAAHLATVEAVAAAIATFVAMNLTASGTYIANDLLDLGPDRNHPRKRYRPLASGDLPLNHGIAMAPLLVVLGVAGAFAVDPPVAAMVVLYLLVTTAYSLYLKRKMFIDVVTLAALYTTRVLAGAVAVGVVVSPWFLAFSMFLFLMLAIVKRHRELSGVLDERQERSLGRNYVVADLPVLAALGAASGFSAVVVLALYLNSPEVGLRYAVPEALWLLCPLLIYWIGRVLMLANRGQVDDDPVVFAMRDRPSLGVGVLGAAIVLIAL